MLLSSAEIKKDWDTPFRYVFSGLLNNPIHDMVMDAKGFEPLSMLEIPKDPYSVRKILRWKDEGFVDFFILDSGAYSVFTGNFDLNQDSYADFINMHEGKLDAVAQLDTIPGKRGVPTSPEDYEESAKQSWEDFLSLRERIYDPSLLMPIFHGGEDHTYLKRMLDFRDSDGNPLQYIGLAPANNRSLETSARRLLDMYKVIHSSSNPQVKTHVYGYTSLINMSMFPCYSADSTTHRIAASLNKVQSFNFGTISTIRKGRADGNRTGMSFFDTADKHNLEKFRAELEYFGIDLAFAKRHGYEGNDLFSWLTESYSARCAVSILNLQRMSKDTLVYKDGINKFPTRLF